MQFGPQTGALFSVGGRGELLRQPEEYEVDHGGEHRFRDVPNDPLLVEGDICMNPLLVNDVEVNSYDGYSCTDMYEIDPRFGSNELYKNLSFECSQNGIKLIWMRIILIKLKSP